MNRRWNIVYESGILSRDIQYGYSNYYFQLFYVTSYVYSIGIL